MLLGVCPNRLSRARAIVLFLAVLPLSGCLFRSHKVEQRMSTAPLKTATQEELIQYINDQAAKIKSMEASVDIDTSVGGVKKGTVTDYKEIRGYLLVRKPDMLRLIGLMPIVRNRAFDMVSDGQHFKLWIPAKNRFITGSNNLVQPSKNPLENLRPQVLYAALLLDPVDAEKEIAVMQNDYETVTDSKGHKVLQPVYVIEIIKKKSKGGWYLSRKIIFSRTDLLPHRQLIYDEEGNLATDARYDDFKNYTGVNFPNQIEIWRPQEEYSILLKIVKLELNRLLTDEQFALQQPAGAEITNLDQKAAVQHPETHGSDHQ
jgi:outer membrane lipoprotein-sorting protein